jgi:hypothetical protein
MQRLCKIQVNRRPIGLEFQRPGEQRDGIGTISHLSKRHPQQLEDVAIIWSTLQQCLVARHRVNKAAGTMRLYRGGELRLLGLIVCIHGGFLSVPNAKSPTAAQAGRQRRQAREPFADTASWLHHSDDFP